MKLKIKKMINRLIKENEQELELLRLNMLRLALTYPELKAVVPIPANREDHLNPFNN